MSQTRWIKRIEGYLIPPPINSHCIIACLDNENDKESIYTINTIYDGEYISIDDGIGEVIRQQKVIAYFIYDYNELIE